MFFWLVVHSPPTQWSQPERFLVIGCQVSPSGPWSTRHRKPALRAMVGSRCSWAANQFWDFLVFIPWHRSHLGYQTGSSLKTGTLLLCTVLSHVPSYVPTPLGHGQQKFVERSMWNLLGFHVLTCKNERIRLNNLTDWENFKAKRDLGP